MEQKSTPFEPFPDDEQQELIYYQPTNNQKKGVLDTIVGWFSDKKIQPESIETNRNSIKMRNNVSLEGTGAQQKQSHLSPYQSPYQTLPETPRSRASTILLSDGQARQSIRIKRLPQEFAERVHELELNIEIGSFDTECVDKLLEYYSDAVAYYNSKGEQKKSVFYESKIQNIMVKPSVILLMQGNQNIPFNTKSNEETFLELREIEKKRLVEQLNQSQKQIVDYQNSVDPVYQAAIEQNKIREAQVIKNRQEAKIEIRNDLNTQHAQLATRLADRKQKSQAQTARFGAKKSFNFNFHEQMPGMDEGDISMIKPSTPDGLNESATADQSFSLNQMLAKMQTQLNEQNPERKSQAIAQESATKIFDELDEIGL